MAENVVVKENLDENMIKSGAELTRKLDDLNWIVSASMWFYFTEQNQWRLILGSSSVGKDGPKKAYKNIQLAISKLSEEKPKISLQDITVVDTSHPLLKLMGHTICTGNGISGIRFSKNVINGQLIEDAYIYRMI